MQFRNDYLIKFRFGLMIQKNNKYFFSALDFLVELKIII